VARSRRPAGTSPTEQNARARGDDTDPEVGYWLDEPPPDQASATPTPEEYVADEEDDETEPPHGSSATAAAAEALHAGVFPEAPPAPEVPGEDQRLQGGDPEVDPLENEFSGDELPGSSMATPEQNDVDEIGRAYGITEEDAGELQLGEEPVARRDTKRWELDPASAKRR
jgi:hypothetical protein